MKIVQLIENLDESYGGPAKSIPYLASGLASLGLNVELFSTIWHSEESNAVIEEKKLTWKRFYSPLKPFAYSPSLYKELLNSKADIIHVNNAWNATGYYALKVKKQNNNKIVCSIRGSTSQWALSQKKIIKKIIWHLWQKELYAKADLIHATNETEFDNIRRMGIKSPCAIIPNGIDLSEFDNMPSKFDAIKQLNIAPNKKNILFASRIHPVKGLEKLFEAISKIKKTEFANWQLLIAGPKENLKYYDTLLSMAEKLNIKDKVVWLGILNKQDRLFAFSVADFFVLPSYSENFGICIAEALAAKVPVLTTKGTPWKELTTKQCGWYIDLSVDNLYESLLEMINLSEEKRLSMGERGKKLMYTKYGWKEQCRKMAESYKWLFNKREKPEWIFE